MRVKITGFHLKPGSPSLQLPDFSAELARRSNTSDKFGGKELIFFAGERSGYLVGLVVTIRDQKTFTEMRRKAGKVILQARSLEEGTSFIDFNYFLINRKTGYGLYQTYWHAWSFGRLGAYLAEQYRSLVRGAEREEIERLGGEDQLRRRDKAELRKRFKGSLDFAELVREDKLPELLEEFESIRTLDYTAATPEIPEKQFKGLNPLIENRRTIVRFKQDVRKDSALRRALASTLDEADVEKGRIHGKDFEGYDRIVDLISNPDVFAQIDYDAVSAEIQLEIGKEGEGAENFTKSPMVDRLLSIAKKHSELFS